MKDKDYISLKWGALKRWEFHSKKCQKLLKKYFKLGHCVSAIFQKDTPEQKELLCQMIDECNADKIHLDWDDVYISKDEAKKYVRNYRMETEDAKEKK